MDISVFVKGIVGGFLLGILMVLVLSVAGYAEVNTRVDLGISGQQNNVDILSSEIGVRMDKVEADNKLRIGADYVISKVDGDRNAENISIYGEYDQDINKTNMYFGCDGGFENDYSSKLSRRVSVSPFYGVYLLDRQEVGYVGVDGGLTYSVEKYQNMALTDEVSLRVRGKGEYKISANSNVEARIVYLPELDNKDDYRIKGIIELRTGIIDNLSLKTKVSNEYDNMPVSGERNDTRFSVGVSYEF